MLFSLFLSFSLILLFFLFICFSQSCCVALLFPIVLLFQPACYCYYSGRDLCIFFSGIYCTATCFNSTQPSVFRNAWHTHCVSFSSVFKLLSHVHKLMFPHLWKEILAQHYDYSAQILWVERTVNKTCLRPRKWPTYTDMLCCAFNPFHPLASDFNSSVRTWLAFSFFPEQVWGGEKNKKLLHIEILDRIYFS